jgi:hypothetical protein
MLAARTRSSGGKTRYSIAMPTGASMPPPTPWRIRNSTSSVMLAASPQSAEASVKITMAPSRTRFPPSRSPSHPEAGMNTARLTRKEMETALTAVGATWKVRPMVGRATFTMVVSMIDMNMAATKTVPTAIF